MPACLPACPLQDTHASNMIASASTTVRGRDNDAAVTIDVRHRHHPTRTSHPPPTTHPPLTPHLRPCLSV